MYSRCAHTHFQTDSPGSAVLLLFAMLELLNTCSTLSISNPSPTIAASLTTDGCQLPLVNLGAQYLALNTQDSLATQGSLATQHSLATQDSLTNYSALMPMHHLSIVAASLTYDTHAVANRFQSVVFNPGHTVCMM